MLCGPGLLQAQASPSVRCASPWAAPRGTPSIAYVLLFCFWFSRRQRGKDRCDPDPEAAWQHEAGTQAGGRGPQGTSRGCLGSAGLDLHREGAEAALSTASGGPGGAHGGCQDSQMPPAPSPAASLSSTSTRTQVAERVSAACIRDDQAARSGAVREAVRTGWSAVLASKRGGGLSVLCEQRWSTISNTLC